MRNIEFYFPNGPSLSDDRLGVIIIANPEGVFLDVLCPGLLILCQFLSWSKFLATQTQSTEGGSRKVRVVLLISQSYSTYPSHLCALALDKSRVRIRSHIWSVGQSENRPASG